MDNPLAPRSSRKSADHPMMMHAQTWQHVASMPQDEMAQKAQTLGRILPVLGALASNPKVTSKDVIKAAATATAAGIRTPEEAIQFITQIPSDPDKVQPWLRSIYAANLSAVVHMKASLIQAAQGNPPPQQPAQPTAVAPPQQPPAGAPPP